MGMRADFLRTSLGGGISPIVFAAALMAATAARAQVAAGPPLPPLPLGPVLGPVDPAMSEEAGVLQRFFPGLPIGQADEERKKHEEDQDLGGTSGGQGGLGMRGGLSGGSGTSSSGSNPSAKTQGASSFTVLNPDDIRNAALLPGGLAGLPGASSSSSPGNSATPGSPAPPKVKAAPAFLPTNPVKVGMPAASNSAPPSGATAGRQIAAGATPPRSLAMPSPIAAGRTPQYHPTFLGSKPGATAGLSRRSTGRAPTFLGMAPGTRAAVHKPPMGVGSLARPGVQVSPVHPRGAGGAAHHPGGSPAHHAGAAHHAGGGGHSGGGGHR